MSEHEEEEQLPPGYMQLAQITVDLFLDENGKKHVTVRSADADGNTPSLFDLYGMLGIATNMLADDRWREEQYGPGGGRTYGEDGFGP